MKAYYHARASEYDDWWLGRGPFADRARPGWHEEREELERVVAALQPVRTLDVACGTGFLTRHLRGEVTALDQSDAMLELGRRNAANAAFVQGDALDLPFGDGDFDRLFASYFYCHLEEEERLRFLSEARRVARDLVLVTSLLKEELPPARYEERMLQNGSRWTVFKRYFRPEELLEELGGGEVLHSGHYFLVVHSP